jgi:hypothetical protein
MCVATNMRRVVGAMAMGDAHVGDESGSGGGTGCAAEGG